MKNMNSTFPLETYVHLVFTRGMTRENMDVYLQKTSDSDEFICVSHDESALGQHMVDFIILSLAKLPSLVAELKKLFQFVQTQIFDHHLVPVYLENIFQLYHQIRDVHPWWAATIGPSSLWRDYNAYSHYCIHPGNYTAELYVEVDRLMDEEFYWGSICDQIQSDIRWLESYISILDSFECALVACLDAGGPPLLAELDGLKRAFIFQSFFNDNFLRRAPQSAALTLRELYKSPLGKTVHRSKLLPFNVEEIQKAEKNNLSFRDVIAGKDTPIKLEQLVDMVQGKHVEMTTTFLLRKPEDIYGLCSYVFQMLINSNVKIRKCKNCGKYFVPINRSDEMYCCRVQENGKMCRELDYVSKINDDDLLLIYRTAYKTHNARKQRNMKNRASAEQDFKNWVVFAKRLLEQAKAGELSSDEFRELIRK